jgi:hypothetical protein
MVAEGLQVAQEPIALAEEFLDMAEEPIEVVAGAEEVRLGSYLFTLVEPHRGHEVDYNRWYERDHLYAGCMIGPYNFAARRFVATAPLKRMRDPDPSGFTGGRFRGTYLALYWILAGRGDVWGQWAGRQVKALHRAARMFEHRDHVHTALYDFAWSASHGENGVPAELALDHPFDGLVVEVADLRGDPDGFRQSVSDAVGELAGSLAVAGRPQPMRASAPGVEKMEAPEGRLVVSWFLPEWPGNAWERLSAHRREVEKQGSALTVAMLPFVPTVPGTDTYTDDLWVD